MLYSHYVTPGRTIQTEIRAALPVPVTSGCLQVELRPSVPSSRLKIHNSDLWCGSTYNVVIMQKGRGPWVHLVVLLRMAALF